MIRIIGGCISYNAYSAVVYIYQLHVSIFCYGLELHMFFAYELFSQGNRLQNFVNILPSSWGMRGGGGGGLGGDALIGYTCSKNRQCMLSKEEGFATECYET